MTRATRLKRPENRLDILDAFAAGRAGGHGDQLDLGVRRFLAPLRHHLRRHARAAKDSATICSNRSARLMSARKLLANHFVEGEVYLFEIVTEGLHRCTRRRLEIARTTTARHDHERPVRLDSDMRRPLGPLRKCAGGQPQRLAGLRPPIGGRYRIHRHQHPGPRHRRLDDRHGWRCPPAKASTEQIDLRRHRCIGHVDVQAHKTGQIGACRLQGQIDIRQNTCRLRSASPSP